MLSAGMSSVLPSTPEVSSIHPVPERLEEGQEGNARAAGAFGDTRRALTDYLASPDRQDLWKRLVASRRIACTEILRLPRKETQTQIADDARQLVQEITRSGVQDHPTETEDLALAHDSAKKGWQGLLAAMLLTPAWQLPDAPPLLLVPEWLRADYVCWLFAAPLGFCATGQAETYASQSLQHLEELVRWINRCPGKEAEAEILGAFVRQFCAIPLYFCKGSLRRHAELRGWLLTRLLGQPGKHNDTPPSSRAGRRLKVGFVNRHFCSQTETYTTLPTFEQLDPDRFEVVLFCHQSGGGALEEHCRRHASGFVALPRDLPGQLSVLRGAGLDILVFGTNVTAVFNDVLRLALFRLAPLQVVNNSSCITSGLPEVDLYISGSLTETAGASAHFSERLGLLPGPTHAFDYEADRRQPLVACRRSDLGLPDDVLVFVSAANYFKIIPEMQHAWARLLASVPGSRLLLHPFNPNWTSSYPINRFCTEFNEVLASYGVDSSRLTVSKVTLPSRTDVKTLLGLGDIYLDTYPFSGVNSLIDPLELGIPVVTWEGETMRARMGGSLLRELDFPEMIASSEADYHRIAVTLATASEAP